MKKNLVNMDETNVYFNSKPKLTVHAKEEKTISIRIGSTTSQYVTLCVSIAMVGTKIPLFLIFKATYAGHIEKNLHNILPRGVYGCLQ